MPTDAWSNLTTLDINPDCKPDVIWDLERLAPLPFEDSTFDEIHAYEILEHLGGPGKYQEFFYQFQDYWRVLKPGGFLFGTSPSRHSQWAWGDPGHKRIMCANNFVFLSQDQYRKQIDVDDPTPMSDYRRWYKGDFVVRHVVEGPETLEFVLEAVKS